MDLLEKLVRRMAKPTTRDGRPALVTDGDADLVEGFAHLGWSDPHVEGDEPPEREAAVLGPPAETASEKRPRARGSR
jgi:hypothetical protein